MEAFVCNSGTRRWEKGVEAHGFQVVWQSDYLSWRVQGAVRNSCLKISSGESLGKTTDIEWLPYRFTCTQVWAHRYTIDFSYWGSLGLLRFTNYVDISLSCYTLSSYVDMNISVCRIPRGTALNFAFKQTQLSYLISLTIVSSLFELLSGISNSTSFVWSQGF